MSQAILKREPVWDWREEYIFRYFQMYLRVNANPKPDVTGAYLLGDIEDPAPKNWTKATPYSPAVRKTGPVLTGERTRNDAGLSLTETLVVLGLLLLVAVIGLPMLWQALQDVRGWLALVNQTVVH